MDIYRIIAKAIKTAIPCIFVLLLFGCATYFSDPFSGTLDPSYRKFDENRIDNYEIVGGQLRITASRGEDLWGGTPLKRGAPLLLHAVPGGDYEVESLVAAGQPGTTARINTQVGLFVFKNVENWLFFGFTFHKSQAGTLPEGYGLIVTSTIGDASRIESYEEIPPGPVTAPSALVGTLKIRKSGNSWRFYVKSGSAWNQVGPPVGASLGNHEVGMGAKSFQSGGTAAFGYFDNFVIRN